MAELFTPPGDCPVCGEAVPRGARACPECGADERTGWDTETSRYDGLDLPMEELGRRRATYRPLFKQLWPITGMMAIAALILAFILR